MLKLSIQLAYFKHSLSAAIESVCLSFSRPNTLVIEKTGSQDSGRYTCLATNEAGTLEQHYNLHVLGKVFLY